MNIGVSGASGKLGQAVVRELRARAQGHKIVAISRTPESTDAIEGRVGDYDKPESLAAAYAGLDRLLLIPSSDIRPGARGHQLVAAIDAAVEAGVKHIVFMSAAGTSERQEPAHGASYWLTEQHLIRNAPAWTILRMNYYAELFGDEIKTSVQQGGLIGYGENRVAFVARDDVAAAAVGILIGEGHPGAIYDATGPRTYGWAERAALASEILGAPLGTTPLAPEILRAGLTQAGLPEGLITLLLGIQQDFVDGAFDIVTGDVEKLAGRPPKDLQVALSGYLK